MTTTKSVTKASEWIAADRNVSWEMLSPGGHGRRALSLPMRDDSPAARMTPAKLGARSMLRKIAETCEKVSDGRDQSAVESYAVTLFLNQLRWGREEVAWRRMAISSAVMEMPISSGVTAPISSPIGE